MCYRCHNCNSVVPQSTKEQPQPRRTVIIPRQKPYGVWDSISGEMLTKHRTEIAAELPLCEFCYEGNAKGIPLAVLARQRKGEVALTVSDIKTLADEISKHSTTNAFTPSRPPITILGVEVLSVPEKQNGSQHSQHSNQNGHAVSTGKKQTPKPKPQPLIAGKKPPVKVTRRPTPIRNSTV